MRAAHSWPSAPRARAGPEAVAFLVAFLLVLVLVRGWCLKSTLRTYLPKSRKLVLHKLVLHKRRTLVLHKRRTLVLHRVSEWVA